MANTHLGVPAHDLVLLESIGVADSPDTRISLAFFRIKYDTGLKNLQAAHLVILRLKEKRYSLQKLIGNMKAEKLVKM